MVRIVKVNVTQTAAPTPSTLQGTGAIVSQGGTNLAPNTLGLITQPSDLTAFVPALETITSVSWATGVATVTVPVNYLPASVPTEPVQMTISGAAPIGYNGTYAATIVSGTTFTVPIATNPGAITTPGIVTLGDVPELLSQVTTFFSQGSNTAVYVLELGSGAPNQGVTALTTWLVANPGTVYAFLLPREWDGEPTLTGLLAAYQSTTSKAYFIITSTLATRSRYTNLMKDAEVWIEAPGIPATEFTAAAAFYVKLAYAPSTLRKVSPYCFSFLYGVTPYPVKATQALLSTLATGFYNFVATGAEGGITNAMIYPGTTMDGRDGAYWFSVDWVQINVDLDLANEIINGSNNPQAPLYYDQTGVDRLQARATKTMLRGTSYGLVLGPITVVAVPFYTYVNLNPGDYKVGVYNGLAVTYTPNRGFRSITFNVAVTDFPLA